jgi:tripartite-type tricarboxylate transporter receptor subunit TctC
MNPSRRKLFRLAVGVAAAPIMYRSASALDYPSRPVRLIIGFPSGTAPDITGRLIGQWLSERFGQQFIIDNRPGASSSLAVETVAKASADGYTLLLALSSNAVNAALYTNLSFNVVRDIAPIAFIGGNPFVMVVTPSLPVKTLAEFIAYAKANPGKINMASQGVGTTPHVCAELLRMMTGITFTHVPYRTPLMPDLLAGQVHFYFSPLPQPIEYVRDGRLRALGVSTAARVEVLPDVPAIGEIVPGYNASGWFGLGEPDGTPIEIVEKLNNAINELLADSEVKARLASLGLEPRAMTPTEFGKFVAAETEKWASVIKFAGIKPE